MRARPHTPASSASRDSLSFYGTAQALSKNPLSVIALFIVLIYAVVAIVISRDNGSFYSNPYHPAVLFMALFPLAVLLVFGWLVAYYHKHLYSPSDFADERLWVQMAGPARLRKMETGVTTSTGEDAFVEDGIIERLDSDYAAMIDFGFIMLHISTTIRARTVPGSGLFKTRVWIEPLDKKNSLSEIESVTYRVWDDFTNPVVTSTTPDSNFDLWLQTYGEFPIMAIVKKKNGKTYELIRHMDLPGRPMD